MPGWDCSGLLFHISLLLECNQKGKRRFTRPTWLAHLVVVLIAHTCHVMWGCICKVASIQPPELGTPEQRPESVGTLLPHPEHAQMVQIQPCPTVHIAGLVPCSPNTYSLIPLVLYPQIKTLTMRSSNVFAALLAVLAATSTFADATDSSTAPNAGTL
ncbi:hypothetical protein BCR44DRAFT_216398 [Catenaria anguillulae PL171]|uniref:Uncharacterized protein n=1 Tax=Catenaria anguillulae PL171 TaxID=765915 RepID=A0A1Y2HSY6_9FUNG|nr:hypothetical protein BCR44DRAFT_216398 [Catenaria anguillulae PL171]